MRFHQATLVGAILLSWNPASAQDVEATFSIRPSTSNVPCELSNKAVAAITEGLTPDRIAAMTGCPGRKVSSFELLGQKTDTYEFVDGRNRLQVTVQNNKVLSHTLRKI